MNINLRVLKREILEKAVAYANQKSGTHLEILSFQKDSKFGRATIAADELNAEQAFQIGMLLNERIHLLTNHRWGKI
jgi:hypothetical protein